MLRIINNIILLFFLLLFCCIVATVTVTSFIPASFCLPEGNTDQVELQREGEGTGGQANRRGDRWGRERKIDRKEKRIGRASKGRIEKWGKKTGSTERGMKGRREEYRVE